MKRVPSPTPVCRVQEVDIRPTAGQPLTDQVDLLNVRSNVALIERRAPPPPVCTLQEVDIRRTERTYPDQVDLFCNGLGG